MDHSGRLMPELQVLYKCENNFAKDKQPSLFFHAANDEEAE